MPTAESRSPEEPDDRPSRAMQIASVRFGARQKAMIDEEAEREGVSTSQFVRDAAVARAIMYRAQRLSADSVMLEAIMRFTEEIGSDAAANVAEQALAAFEHEVEAHRHDTD